MDVLLFLAGCSRSQATCTVGENQIHLDRFSVTRNQCRLPDQMEQERFYLKTWQDDGRLQSARFEIRTEQGGSRLKLLDADGRAMFPFENAYPAH